MQRLRGPEARAALGGAGKVDVGVDQARQERPAGAIQRLSRRILAAGRFHPSDPLISDADRHPLARRRAVAGNDADVPEHSFGRWHGRRRYRGHGRRHAAN